MNTRQRFKLGAGAGLVTMLLGALMVLAPGAGAAVDITDYDVTDSAPTYDVGADTTTFVYSVTGPETLSHIVVGGICASALDSIVSVTPGPQGLVDETLRQRYKTDSSSGAVGFKIGDELSTPFTVTLVFAGEWFEDANGSTWTLWKGPNANRTVTANGPSCEEDVCPEADGLQTDQSECPVDACPDLPGEQGPDDDCTPDACPDLPGEQGPNDDCTPDACPDLPGEQGPNDDCTPDACPDLPGEQGPDDDCTPDACPDLPGEQGPDDDCTPDDGGSTPIFSVSVEKLNDADGDRAFGEAETADDGEGDSVEFQITIRNTGTGALVLAALVDEVPGRADVDLLEDVVLDCGDVTLVVGSVLAVGSETVCTFVLADYAPPAADPLTNTVTVDTDEADATDTSTVQTEEIAVLPAPPVVNEPEVLQPVVQPTEEVKGDVVTRAQTLPRTGDETRHLAGVGVLLVALGAAMVLGSKRQLARH